MTENDSPVLRHSSRCDERTARFLFRIRRVGGDGIFYRGPPTSEEFRCRIVCDHFLLGDVRAGGFQSFGDAPRSPPCSRDRPSRRRVPRTSSPSIPIRAHCHIPTPFFGCGSPHQYPSQEDTRAGIPARAVRPEYADRSSRSSNVFPLRRAIAAVAW
jgi:hypothetical protein